MRSLNDEIPDNPLDSAARQSLSAFVNALKTATPKLIAKIRKHGVPEIREDTVSDLSSRLEEVVQEWHDEQPAGWILDPWVMQELLQTTLADDYTMTIYETIRDNEGLGLREEIAKTLKAEPLATDYGKVPSVFFVAGLVRLLNDWTAARHHLATRPMPDEEARLIDVFDFRSLRARAAYEEAFGNAQDMPSRVDHELSLVAKPLRGPRELNPYLGSLSTAYGEGHSHICLILCRCALEDALRFAFDAHDVDRETLNVKTMIKFAVQAGWLTPEQGAAGTEIRLRANKVLHDGQLDMVKDVRPTIDQTLDIAKALMT